MRIGGELFRYGVAGCVAATVHLAVLTQLIEFIGVAATVASGVGFVVACAVNYLLQHYWVFRARGPIGFFLPRYIFITAATLCLNLCLFWVLHAFFGVWYLVAQVISIGTIFLINFCLNRRFTFQCV